MYGVRFIVKVSKVVGCVREKLWVRALYTYIYK